MEKEKRIHKLSAALKRLNACEEEMAETLSFQEKENGFRTFRKET